MVRTYARDCEKENMKSPLKKVKRNGRPLNEPAKTSWVHDRLNEAINNAGGQVWYNQLVTDAKTVKERVAVLWVLAKCMPRRDRLDINSNVTVQSLAIALTGSADGGATRFVEAVVQDTLESGCTARGFVPAETILKRLGSVSEPEHLIENPQGVTEQGEVGSESK